MELAKLAESAQEGDDRAFDELVRATLPDTYRFLRKIGADSDDADDAAQEAYVRAWRALGRFDVRKPFLPWLFQIAKRAYFDIIRKRKIVPRTYDIDEQNDRALQIADTEPLQDAAYEREEMREHMRKARAELSSQEQLILSLRYDDEFSFEDISQTLEIPSASVRSIHRRALIKMRGVLPA